MILYIDATTSTGVWQWKLPDDDERQPVMVRLAAALDEREQMCRLISPRVGAGVINALDVPLLNIDDNDLRRDGRPLREVMNHLSLMLSLASEVVMYNAAFHRRVVHQAYIAAGLSFPGLPPTTCAMHEAAYVIAAQRRAERVKWVRLSEAYSFFAREAMVLPADPVACGIARIEAVRTVHHGIRAFGPAAA